MIHLEHSQETEAKTDAQARQALKALSRSGAVLALARDMEAGVIVRDTETGGPEKLGVVSVSIAETLAVNGWITSQDPSARIVRYRISPSGHDAFKILVAKAENAAGAFQEAPVTFDHGARVQMARTAPVETPLLTLSRLKDRQGQPFLAPEMVLAGERMREDYEISKLSRYDPPEWSAFVTGAADLPPADAIGTGAALRRTADALRYLGPGLGDVALRCCCFLEGLETAEKKMGWSARSAKIVLRIALQRLARHYATLDDNGGAMIG